MATQDSPYGYDPRAHDSVAGVRAERPMPGGVKQNPPILNELSATSNLLNELHTLIHEVEARAEAVLRPMGDKEEASKGLSVDDVSPLLHEMTLNNYTLRRALRRLADLRDRLQV